MKRFRRGLATLLCISMAGGMFPVPVSAERTVSAPDIAVESAGQQNTGTEEETGGELALYGAQTKVPYLEYDESSHTMASRTCNSATEVTSADTSWGTAGQDTWYVASGNITMENRVTAKGNVHLILEDNCNLIMEKENGNKYEGGISVSDSDYHLYIHAQSDGNAQGKLVCKYTDTSYYSHPALGGAGAVTIDGGDITCESGAGAGIGGKANESSNSGTVTINSGTISATSKDGAGIGSGKISDAAGTVVINGGTVNATSTYGAGIGGGRVSAGVVTITGGDITATGGGYGAGIGGAQNKTGTVTISGGKITAVGDDGAGIGGGYAASGTVTISGGEINATGNKGAGIGGGYIYKNAFENDITITGGLVKAVSQKGSGIGPGYDSGTSIGEEEKLTIENSPFIFASGGSGGMEKGIYKQDGSENWSNIISIDGSDGKVYGTSVTTAMDVEIAEDQTLLVPEGTTLAVGEGKTITNKGTIKVAGKMDSAEADKVTGNKPKYKLITKENPSGIYAEGTGTTAAGKIYYSTYGEKVTVSAVSNYDAGKDLIGWTVDGANAPLQRTSPLVFTMPANAVTVTALYGNKGPAPDLTGKVKVSADTIVISGVEGTETYGDLEFINANTGGSSWESNGTFTGLTPDTEYTIHVRYTGKGDYATSEAARVTVKTKKWADEVEKVTGLTATYGQSLSDVDLPEGWTWKDSSVKLKSVGVKEYDARFTPSDTADVDYSKVTGYVLENGKVYLDISLEVTVTQAKPVIQWAQESAVYTYTGLSVTAEDLPGLSVTLQNNEIYSGTVTYSYREKDSSEAGGFKNGLPTEPGVYEVKAAVPASANYTAAESDIMTLSIQYLEGVPDVVKTDKNGSKFTEWCPAEFYIKAPTDYTISATADGTYGASFVYNAVSEAEQQEITYYLKNDAGQIAKKTLTAKIDRTAPDWNGVNLGINIKKHWWNFLLEEYISKVYKADSLDVKVKANDSQSGVALYGYYVSSGDKLITIEELDERAGCGFFTKVPVNGNGEPEKLTTLFADAASTGKLVYVYAEDAMGNRSSYICSNGVIFDNEAPNLKIMSEEEKVTVSDISAKIWAQCTEQGDYYYICKKAGEPAPASINNFADKTADVSQDADAEVDTWKAKDGVVTGKIISSEYAQQLEITGLTSNTDYVLYMVATDEAGNASDVATLNFTTLKTVPHIETAPRLVGEYGQSLSEMVDAADAKVVAAQGSETEVSGTWSVIEEEKTIIPEIETAETYTLVFTPTGENADRYETASCEVTPDVAKKTVTVVIADKEKVYGQNNPEFTWDFAEGSGLVAGDTNADLGITLDSVAEAASLGGKYAITGSCNSKKYNVNFTGNSADGTSGVLTITKADAPVITGEEQSYIYAAGSEGKTVSVEIVAKLPADKGDAVYSLDVADVEEILREAEVDESGKLTFRVNAVDASKIGKTATIKVKAVLQNYEDAEYTLTVQMTDKKSVELQNGSSVAVEGNNTLTYGQKLSSLNLKKTVFVEAGTNTVVEGILVWSEPEKVPAVGTTQADWVFHPVQDSIYKEMTGTTAITVVKASNVPSSTPAVTPSSTPTSTPASTPSSTPANTLNSTPSNAPGNTSGDASSDTSENTPGSIPESTSDVLKKGMKFTGADGAVYKIISVKKNNPTVMYYAAKKNAKGKVSVPATVKYKGVTFKVVSIRAKAFANRRKVQKVIIGKNVASIGKKAFYNCKKLKKVTIKTTKKIKKKVGTAAFKKTAKNIVFKLPAKKYKVYKKVLKKKGVSRKAIYKKYKKQKKQKQKK